MRHIDEIMSIFPTQVAMGKRYLLRRLERLPITADSSVPMEMVQRAEQSEVSDFARLAEDRYYSRLAKDRLLRASGNRTKESGDWSRFFGQRTGGKAEQQAEDLERAAAQALAPLVPALESAVERSGDVAQRAVKALSRIRIPASLATIQRASRSDLLLHDCMAAYASFGGRAASERALELAHTWKGTPWFPGLVYALRGLPGDEVLTLLDGLAGDEALQAPVATALEGFSQYSVDAVLEKLLVSEDPWTLLHVVETMGRLGGNERAERIGQIFARVDHPLVKVACLQAVAATGSPKGGDVAQAGLAAEHPMVKAAAIEALISLPVPKGSFRDKVLVLLDSEHPRLAMNAALACVVLDSKRAAQRIHKLLKQGSAGHLMQGIHCLAYMEHPSTAPILATLVQRCPPGPLRLQAVRALGRHAEDNPNAASHLAGLLRSDDPEVRRATAYFMAGCENFAREAAVEALTAALHAEKDPGVEAAILEALALAGPLGQAAAPLMVACLEGAPEVRRAAAWALATACPERGEADSLDSSPLPGVRAWGCLRRWIRDGSGLDDLVDLLGEANAEDLVASLEVARLAAEVTTFASEPDNLSGLAAALSRQAALTQASSPRSPEAGSSEGASARDQLVQLISSGTHRRDQELTTFESVDPQLLSQDGSLLPTEAETSEALEAWAPSRTEAIQAVNVASYYSLPKEELARVREAALAAEPEPVEPQEPARDPAEAPGSEAAPPPEQSFLQFVAFLLLAFVTGQVARILLH